MDRAAIEELLAFTDYSWGEHELAIRPLGDDVLTQVESLEELEAYRRRVRGRLPVLLARRMS